MSYHRYAPILMTALLGLGAPLSAADDHAEHAHGNAEAVGTLAIGVHSVAVSAAGGFAAGTNSHIELRLTPQQPRPTAIRLWVGTENGRGSAKAKATAASDGTYDAHVEVPLPLPADSRIWIAFEPEAGKAVTGSLPLPQAKPGHHEGDGHAH